MAIINLYTKDTESTDYDLKIINHDGSALGWVVENIKHGENFEVYEGALNKGNEISRDAKRVYSASEVSVFLLPGDAVTALYFVAAVLAVTLLTPKIPTLQNVNRRQQSPNNSISSRDNQARPNQRIVDICGREKSIPDVLASEYARFENNVEERIGYYCVARNDLLIEDVKDGDTLISDIEGASVGVYGPNKSPNNSSPDLQIGDLINENVHGVYQSPDAIGQTIKAPNENTLILDDTLILGETGYIRDPDGTFNFSDSFTVGDNVDLIDLSPEGGGFNFVGEDTHIVIAVTTDRITFDITGDPSWSIISTEDNILTTPTNLNPRITDTESDMVGPFKITSFKIDRLLVNVNAINGMYKEDQKGRVNISVDYIVYYQKLDDNFQPVGPKTAVNKTISGRSADEKGITADIDLLGLTYVEWSVERVTPIDFDFQGQIVDSISVKSVFGLFTINNPDFGNVTTIQTRRTSNSATNAIKSPQLNCIATELVFKYLGNDVFDNALSPNTQAMQSLIRLALDPFIGRRELSELDADLLIQSQEECEVYFNDETAGQFSYSFDSTSLSAQDTFTSIGNAAFMTLWREGRILKSLFEKPQSVPSMVFTHRSKQPNAENWNRKRNTAEKKDGIEFTYTDSKLFTKETLYFPANRSAKNPLRSELTGVKGLNQATWHMMRQFNKLTYQEITVDFGATSEGRFVKPNRLISVVKGTRVGTFDGNITNVNGLIVTLSQAVSFTANDDHYLILKRRDGSTESLMVAETSTANIVQLLQIPSEDIYTGNDELKTEFSFGNEAILSGQLMLPTQISPSDNRYVNIKAVNYSDLYYKDDPTQPTGSAFSSGFDDGFS